MARTKQTFRKPSAQHRGSGRSAPPDIYEGRTSGTQKHTIPVVFKLTASEDVKHDESVSLLIGGKTHRMAPPSPACDAWRVCVAIPPGEHQYQYAVTDTNSVLKRHEHMKEEGEDGRSAGRTPQIMKRSVPTRRSAILLIVMDTFEDFKRNWASVTPSEQEFEHAFTASALFSSTQRPSPFTLLPDPDALPASLPNTATIHTSASKAVTLQFEAGACHLTKRLATNVACGTVNEVAVGGLIEQGANIKDGVEDGNGRRLSLVGLVVAYHHGPAAGKVLRALLDAGAPIDASAHAEGRTTIEVAIREGRWALLEILLEPQYKAAVNGMQLLSEMAVEGEAKGLSPAAHLRIVKKIAKRDRSVLTEVHGNGKQPIHCYCKHTLPDPKCQEQLIDYFVEMCGRDIVNATDSDGRRPLWDAYFSWPLSRTGRKETIQRFYYLGAAEHINTPDSSGSTLLWDLAREMTDDDEYEPSGVPVEPGLLDLLTHGASLTAAGVTPQRAIREAGVEQREREPCRGCDMMRDMLMDIDYDYEDCDRCQRMRGYVDEYSDEEDEANWPLRRIVRAYETFVNTTVPHETIRAINTALQPSRSIAASLAQPIPISETTHATLPPEIQTTIASLLTASPSLPIGEKPFGTRIDRALQRYVTAASRSIIQDGNVHVVGGPGQPPLRPFAIGGVANRCMSVCEVLYRAVRSEAQRWGIELSLRHGLNDDDRILDNMQMV
ncbi:unnamed protein product [Vitrella brassicaformis CCMP3155]|uniref:Uncharacterized protein n=1 Tax=Vitrella brassicaformis (strain CCMP3155) TaxID=1169540 RepID=A0A0G4GYA0_VITBC|nr:unnamed protein product [Vitrella brassicaformis CCMP3155]|eukprot:CEM36108.1 unnamed protein product [Vitrella brassicaformis CCMP3155]